MYRINDRSEAIRRVQRYLTVAGNPEIFVAPTGVFDDNTRLSVIDFQKSKRIEESGVVDKITFDLLFEDFTFINERESIREKFDSFITFPLFPGEMSDGMMHINRTLSRLLNHYGLPNDVRNSNFYSPATSIAVGLLQKIYLLEEKNMIDEKFYSRMVEDHNSIEDARDIFL